MLQKLRLIAGLGATIAATMMMVAPAGASAHPMAPTAKQITHAQTLTPDIASAYDISWGTLTCDPSQVGVSFPTIGDSNIGKVWTRSYFYLRASPYTGEQWTYVGPSHYFWQNSFRSIYDWNDATTGQTYMSDYNMSTIDSPRAGLEYAWNQYLLIQGHWYRHWTGGCVVS